MKIRSKLLIALTSIVLGTVGCQEVDMVSEQPNGTHIQFSPYIGKAGAITRGTPLTAFEVGDRFKVFAFDEVTKNAFFDNVTVSMQEGGAWTYSPLKVWSKEFLNFYAYSPVANPLVTPNITADNQTFELSVPTNVDEHVDLVIAGAKGLNKVDVPLTFKHITSRVSFRAAKDVVDAAKEKVRINSIKIEDEITPAGGLISKGVFTVTDITTPTMGNWTPDVTTAIYAPELTHATSIDLTTTPQSITKENQSMFLIPQQLNDKRLVVDYEFSLDGGFSWTKYVANIKLYGTNSQGNPILPAGFEQGKHYQFTLNLKAARTYTFTPTIEPWDDEDVSFTPAAPLSVERLETGSKASVERFVITDESKMGYTITSQAATWMKIGSKSNLSFTDAAVKGTFVYTDGMTRATGDVSDPAQDFYIYLAPNYGGERRSSIKVTFKDTKKPDAFIQVIQAPTSGNNPIMVSNKAIRIYTTANTAINGLEISQVSSLEEALTKDAKITAPINSTLAAPTSPVDITTTARPIVLNLASNFGAGNVTIQTNEFASNVAVYWSKNVGIGNTATHRAVQGKFVKAEIINPESAEWCKLSLDGVKLSNPATTVSSSTATDIYLVTEPNTTAAIRKVVVKLTDEAGGVTIDHYSQDPSTLIEPQLTADAGMVYIYGASAYRIKTVTLTSQAARTYAIGSVGSIGVPAAAGGGNWTATATGAGATRALSVDLHNASALDSYITATSSATSTFVIPVKLNKALPATGGKVFIPGEYDSAMKEGAGAATVSNSDSDPGEASLATVTNPNGVWIHYGQNNGATRSTCILLKNSSDWKKTTRVWIYQGEMLANYNKDYTDLARPVKFAGSNIYVNEAGELTFDDVNVTTHSKYQGIFFCYGSLTGIQPTLPIIGTGVVWKPEEYASNAVTTMPIIAGAPNHTFAVHTRYNPSTAQGDICRYMTEKGLAPKGKKWRLPTSMEYSRTAQNGFTPVNPYNATNPNPGTASDAVGGVPGKNDLGRREIESGVIMAGTFFPAGGLKLNASSFYLPTYVNTTYWSSCVTMAYMSNASVLDINVKTLDPAPDLGDLPYIGGWQVARNSPIRCVVDEDNTY